MDIEAAIKWKYPNAISGVDFIVGVGQTIKIWRFFGEPQPSTADLQEWWIPALKDLEINSLRDSCGKTILGGFQSSALGATHTYESDEESQRNRLSTMLRLTFDPSINSIIEKTKEAGHVEHTREQFIQLFKDQHDHIEGTRAKYRDMKAQVLASTTEEAIYTITR